MSRYIYRSSRDGHLPQVFSFVHVARKTQFPAYILDVSSMQTLSIFNTLGSSTVLKIKLLKMTIQEVLIVYYLNDANIIE